MSANEPVVVLEIGTSRTVLAVGEALGENRVRITAFAAIPSSGVRKGQITNVQHAKISVDSVLKAMNSSYEVGSAVLLVTGPHVKAKKHVASWQVQDKVVSNDDLLGIEQNANMHGIDEKEREILDSYDIGYQLDDITGILSPLGMSGRMLQLYTLYVHTLKARVDDARNVAAQARLEISSVAYAGICSAVAVVTPQDKTDGAVVIDLGGGTTDFTVWMNDNIAYAETIPVGGDHVTDDVRQAFGVSLNEAERLKKQHANAVITVDDMTGRVEVSTAMPGSAASTISQRALNTVVNARIQELFMIINERLEEQGFQHAFSAGVILTGGGAKLAGIVSVAEAVFGCRVRIGTLLPEIELDKSLDLPEEDVENHAALATVAGALLTIRPTQQSKGFFDSLGGLFRKGGNK